MWFHWVRRINMYEVILFIVEYPLGLPTPKHTFWSSGLQSPPSSCWSVLLHTADEYLDENPSAAARPATANCLWRRNMRCHTYGSHFPLFPFTLSCLGSAGLHSSLDTTLVQTKFKNHQCKCFNGLSICQAISRAQRKAGTSLALPTIRAMRAVPQRLVSPYDPFLATVQQAHPTHTGLCTCMAKLEQMGRDLHLKYQHCCHRAKYHSSSLKAFILKVIDWVELCIWNS